MKSIIKIIILLVTSLTTNHTSHAQLYLKNGTSDIKTSGVPRFVNSWHSIFRFQSTNASGNAFIAIKNKHNRGADLGYYTNPSNQNDEYFFLNLGTTSFGDFIIRKGGNVGIGTITPDSKLAVNGKIHAKEVKVDLVGWPDFVFDKRYNLSTLEEVENHIKENGHLKNIPSAAAVEKNGILLGEMNAKLLQKIEELTLYMIAQEKNLQAQKQQLMGLKEKMQQLEDQQTK